MKCIDEEIPFEIPDKWCWCRIGNLFLHASGKQQSSNNKSKGTPQKFITTSNLYWGYFNLANVKVMNFTDEEIRTCSATKGDLLVCEGGAGYGRSAIWDKDYDICLQNHVHRLRPVIPGVCEYVYYFIYLLKQSNQLLSVGTAMPGLSANRLKSLIIPVPPIEEQIRIVSRIDRLMQIIEKYELSRIKLDEIEAELCLLLKKSILQYAIQGKLVPQDPHDEDADKLLSCISEEKVKLLKAGRIKKKDLSDSYIFKGEDNKYYEQIGSKLVDITEEIPYELPNNWVFTRLSTLCWLDEGVKSTGEKLPYLDAKHHRGRGDITYLTSGKVVTPPCKVILVDGENSGEIFDIKEKGYLGSTFKVLKISKSISEEWLHKILENYRGLFKNNKVGAAIPHLNKNLFKNLIIGLPPVNVQIAISNKIDLIFKSIEG